ncbi:BspA family leucine-rich repeat surface protein [uncultured Brachyspira sp.]|uniref:BspA family leucine-rich repeat surface protein n=1 Tax=uncultured Brachyspira sp. TaxID=221953 RepID=UPI00262B2488|nr:BspA family leucine-rich repeat surface protein [uncultured Brachyspira sp.]
MNKKYIVKYKYALLDLLKDENINLSEIDTSSMIDMSYLFQDSKRKNFDGIETWDVSNVVNMESMFEGAINFDSALDKWNVSNVKDMSLMFCFTKSFNQPLNNWNVSNVTSISQIFHYASSFNHPLDNWDVSNVEYMNAIFYEAESFNQNLEFWNVSNRMRDVFNNSAMKNNTPSLV